MPPWGWCRRSFANRRFCERHLQTAPGLDPILLDLLSDAQTNGGLLLAVDPGAATGIVARFQEAGCPQAAVIGAVTGRGSGRLRVEA